MSFVSNVQPKKMVAVMPSWTCSHCAMKNSGSRYSCASCGIGRRPKQQPTA